MMSSSQQQHVVGPSRAQQHGSASPGNTLMSSGGHSHRHVSFGQEHPHARLNVTGTDPRLSTGSIDSHISEMFASRRSSAGSALDGLDMLGRRESVESTTAVLDACILDLTRRRLSMANPLGAGPHGNPFGPESHSHSHSPYGPRGNIVGESIAPQQAHASIALRQQQLQKQQFELEQRQKDLERQRQQLLAGISDKEDGATASSGSLRQHWWVCHVCNSKAFSSREEAMQHEAICPDGHGHGPPAPHRHSVGMGNSVSGLPGSQGGVGPHSNHAFHGMPVIPSGASMANGINGMQMPGGLSDISPNHHHHAVVGSNGPFAMLPQSIPLAMNSDKDWLTPLHCFVRRHCVQVFCASQQDVATPSKGKRKPIQVGQVGIRCPHCHAQPGGTRERGSVYYPTTISSIYNATMNLLQRHLHSCSAVPEEIMKRYQTLKADDARSGTSKKYWVESALSLGLVDTPQGIRFSALIPPPLPRLSRQQHSTGVFSAKRRNSNDFFSTKSNAVTDGHKTVGSDEDDPVAVGSNANSINGDYDDSKSGAVIPQAAKALSQSAPLVTPEDKPYATAFSYHLLSQMQPCVFTEADRLGKRKGLPPGFAGLACRHCFGGYGSGRFFPSSIKTLSDTSKTLNVLHNHMMRCRKCPQEVKDTLEKLRVHHDDERAKMKFGSQKAFFAKIWRRLHEDGTNPTSPLKRRSNQQGMGGMAGQCVRFRGPGQLGAGGAGNPMNQFGSGAFGMPHHQSGGIQGAGGQGPSMTNSGKSAMDWASGFSDAKRMRTRAL